MNTVEREVLTYIGESTTSPDVFSDDNVGMAPIRDSINDSIKELCMVAGAYIMPYLLTLEQDEIFYELKWGREWFGYVTEAFDRNRRVRLTQTDPIALSSFDPQWMASNGDVTHYYHVGINKIGLYRRPSTSGGVLELKCVCIPKPYEEDTDIVKLRENYRRASVFYAVSEFYASRGDAVKAKDFLDQYLETANLMRLKPLSIQQQYRFGGKE